MALHEKHRLAFFKTPVPEVMLLGLPLDAGLQTKAEVGKIQMEAALGFKRTDPSRQAAAGMGAAHAVPHNAYRGSPCLDTPCLMSCCLGCTSVPGCGPR